MTVELKTLKLRDNIRITKKKINRITIFGETNLTVSNVFEMTGKKDFKNKTEKAVGLLLDNNNQCQKIPVNHDLSITI